MPFIPRFKSLGFSGIVYKLETLKLGISNKSDVLLSLGEPRGYGAGRYSSVPEPREIWSYEYVVSDGKKQA
jgi:hypothetical protein